MRQPSASLQHAPKSALSRKRKKAIAAAQDPDRTVEPRPLDAPPDAWALTDYLQPMWPLGLVIVQVALLRWVLPAQGENYEIQQYVGLGSLFVALTVAIERWMVQQGDRSRPGHLTRVALVLVVLLAYLGFVFDTAHKVATASMVALGALALAPHAKLRALCGRLFVFGGFCIIGGSLLPPDARLNLFQHWAQFGAWAAVAVLMTAVLFCKPREDRLVWRRLCDGVAALCLLALSLRSHPIDVHHWAWLAGPAALMREGGHLMWDVPSQYGTLNTWLVAMLPTPSVWFNLYAINAALTFALGTIVYAAFGFLRPTVSMRGVALNMAVTQVNHTRGYALLVVAVGLSCCHRSCGAGANLGDLKASPQFVGRFVADAAHPGAMLFAWSNSTITARFAGTQVEVFLEDITDEAHNAYNVVVDNRPPAVLTITEGRRRYLLAQGLPKGEHSVTLTRRTEAFVGVARFSGFDFGPSGKLLPPPPEKTRRLLFIGDSITAGYGNEGADQNCTYSPATQNSDLAYGPMTARALGAEVHVVAWSGKGVWRNRDGNTNDTLPTLVGLGLPQDADTHWDVSLWQPAAVVVNLGTNDFGPGLAPTAPFARTYADFVQHLRQLYPHSYIVLGLGPMLADKKENHMQLSAARRNMQEVMSLLQGAGITKVGFLEFPAQHGEQGYGCDWHPSLATHARMAAQLTGSLRATLGW